MGIGKRFLHAGKFFPFNTDEKDGGERGKIIRYCYLEVVARIFQMITTA